MRFSLRCLATALLALLAVPPAVAYDGQVRAIASDERGVTLELDVPPFRLGPARADGRRELEVPGLVLTADEGRPKLPYAAVLLALPPGARATFQVLEGGSESAHGDVALTFGDRAVIRDDPDGLGAVPWREAVPAIEDGPWPLAPVVVGEPFELRRRRLVRLELHPYRYDATTRTLWTRERLRVQVRFTGGRATAAALSAAPAPAEDRHWDPVFRSTLLNWDAAQRWRAPAPALRRPSLLPERAGSGRGAELNAFDESEPEVRVRLDTTGVYALEYDRLAPRGYPAGVPVAEVSVHRHEYLEGSDPPYATIELPVEVDDADGDGVFGPGDRILAFVQSWLDRAQPSIPQRLWGEGEVVFVTRVRAPAHGLRISTRAGWRGATLTPLASYPWTQRWERNLDYYKSFSSQADTSIDGYHWTAATTYYDRSETTFPFEVNDLDTSRAVRVSASWVGRGETGHYVWVGVVSRTGLPAAQRVRTTVVDSAYWFGKQPFTASGNAPGSNLSEGASNALLVWGKTNSGAPGPTSNSTAAGTNWFELTYWRAFAALEGALPFNSADAAGEFEIAATGFQDPAALRVYDVTDPATPVRLTGTPVDLVANGQRVRLQDSTAAGARRAYWAFDTPKSLPPERYETVTRRGLYAGASGDYLMVVPESFLATVQPLVDLRRAQGIDVLVVPLESLQDEFNGGRRSAYALRRFFRFALGKWDSRFVLLVGDGSVDPQRFSLQSGVDIVPTQRIMGPLRASSGSDFFLETIVSDTWLVWALESADPQLAPKLPDMHIGRLPARNATELQGVVAKLVAYETVGRDEIWRRRMTLSSDDLYSGVNLFGGGGGGEAGYCLRTYEGVFRQLNETVRGIILDEAGLRQSEPEIFDLKDWLVNQPQDTVGCSTPGRTCRCDAAAFESRARLIYLPELLSRLNSGRLWWNYQGHANEYLLAHEAFYKSNGPSASRDYQSIVNVDRPFLFTAFACHPNAFGHYQENGSVRSGPSLGEMLVLRGGRQGAIGSWGSSGYELLPSSGTAHVNVSLARALFSKPPRDPVLGDGGARVVLGEAITAALLENYQIMRFSPFERDVAISYVLLGDPATRISIGRPQAFVTANGDTVESGVRVALTTPGDSLRVVADLASNVRLDTLQVLFAGATGPPAPLPGTRWSVTPAFPDTGAASSGGRRYQVVVRDTLFADSYRYTLRTVDRWGLANAFDVVFDLDTDLLASGVPVQDGDAVSPLAPLSLVVRSPRALDPAGEIELRLDGALVAFLADTAAGDPSGRSLRLDLQNAALAGGDHVVEFSAAGGARRTHLFRVSVTGPEMRLRDPLAFPNPMEDEGTWFSFYLESRTSTDVLLRVFTVTGQLIYERRLDGLPPSYQQIHWDGRDAEGSELANGLYVYRLIVRNQEGQSSDHTGRLVKLRRPRQTTVDDGTTPP